MQMLVNFDSKLELVLACDASIDLRMVLSHSMPDGKQRSRLCLLLIHFHALKGIICKLRKEALAIIVFGVKHFHLYISMVDIFICIQIIKLVSTLLSESRSFSEDYMRWALSTLRCMGMLLR